VKGLFSSYVVSLTQGDQKSVKNRGKKTFIKKKRGLKKPSFKKSTIFLLSALPTA
jgi:hypothetical protein